MSYSSAMKRLYVTSKVNISESSLRDNTSKYL